MNKEKTHKHTFGSLLLLTPLTLLTLSGTGVFGHDPAPGTPGLSTANYQNFWTIFPHFAIGTSGNVNYSSTIQITNTNRERELKVKLRIYGTAVDGQAARFIADYTINGDPRYSGYSAVDVAVAPLGTETLIFESAGSLKSGFVELNPRGDRKDDISTSFFFQIHKLDGLIEEPFVTYVKTGELIDSVGVAPSDFGWHFAIPIIVSNKGGINTGIAYSHIPISQRIQIVFELRDSAGEQLALSHNTILYPDNVWVEPYHSAQFITEIFADYFAAFEHKHRYSSGATFYGSLHIYAQRNINVLALRMDTKEDGNIQLTSVPSNGELCIDGPNRKDNCFQEDTRLDLGWVPVRKKSQNEIWLENDGVCEEDFDATGVCVR